MNTKVEFEIASSMLWSEEQRKKDKEITDWCRKTFGKNPQGKGSKKIWIVNWRNGEAGKAYRSYTFTNQDHANWFKMRWL